MMLSPIAPLVVPVDLRAQMHQYIVSGQFHLDQLRRRRAHPDLTPPRRLRRYQHTQRATTPCPACGAPVVVRKGRTGYCMPHSQIFRRKREQRATEFPDREQIS